MHGGDRRGRQIFKRKIARRHGVERIAHRPRKAKRRSRRRTVDRIGRAGERGGPERAFVHAFLRIFKPTAIAFEHLHIGEAMMREGDRLRWLQMRESRHNGLGVRAGLEKQHFLNSTEPGFGARARLAQPKAEIGRNLIVARTRRVQPPPRLADELRQPCFDVEMDVLQLALEDEAAFGDLGRDLVEPLHNCIRVGLSDDPLLGQHPGMGLRAGDVLFRQPFVEFDGGVYLLHDGSRAALEASAPHRVLAHGPQPMPGKIPGILTLAAVGAALVVLYVIRPAQASPVPIPPSLAALMPDATPKAVPAVSVVDANGKVQPLSALKGHVVILNLWATWCAPCVEELPAVGKLAAALGSGKVVIVAVNAGHDDAAKTAAFLKAHGAANLSVYRDPDLSLLTAFGSQGLPFSVVIDAKGREIARASGPMKWDDPKAIAYFKSLAPS